MQPGKQKVEVEHQYDATPEAVWAVYVDHARWSEWSGLAGSRLIKAGAPDPNGVGAIRAFVGRTREEIMSFDPPRRMTYRLIGGLLPIKNHLGEVTFEAKNGGTLVRWRCHFDSWVPGLGGPFERMITGMFERALTGLEGRV
jgi:uncharacterized protein YndB with AHSA1/START domain